VNFSLSESSKAEANESPRHCFQLTPALFITTSRERNDASYAPDPNKDKSKTKSRLIKIACIVCADNLRLLLYSTMRALLMKTVTTT
jgi:hypothetical protein